QQTWWHFDRNCVSRRGMPWVGDPTATNAASPAAESTLAPAVESAPQQAVTETQSSASAAEAPAIEATTPQQDAPTAPVVAEQLTTQRSDIAPPQQDAPAPQQEASAPPAAAEPPRRGSWCETDRRGAERGAQIPRQSARHSREFLCQRRDAPHDRDPTDVNTGRLLLFCSALTRPPFETIHNLRSFPRKRESRSCLLKPGCGPGSPLSRGGTGSSTATQRARSRQFAPASAASSDNGACGCRRGLMPATFMRRVKSQ